jgi:hypothetical protein
MGGWIAAAPVATINADGRLDVFVLGGGNIVYHSYQTSPGGGWSGWVSLGGSIAAPPNVAINADGRLQLFAQGTNSAAWTAYQQIPGGNWSSWVSMGGAIIGSPSAAQNADGRLEIFALGGANTVFHNWQASPGGAWSGWNSLGGSIASAPTVGVNDDGRLEVFAVGTDGGEWHVWQTSPDGGWSGWGSFFGAPLESPSVELNGAAGLEIFVRGAGEAVNWNAQTSSGGWTGWNSLGGAAIAPVSVAMNFDGRLETFAIGGDSTMFHNWQLSAAGPWSGWAAMTVASNSAGTDTTYDADFLTDSQNDSNFASAKSGGYQPPWLSASTAWPCGARVNIGITGYTGRALRPFQKGVDKWNQNLFSYYSANYNANFVPVQLYISAGGPQTLSVSRVGDNTIPPPLNHPDQHPRAVTGTWKEDQNIRVGYTTTESTAECTYSQ